MDAQPTAEQLAEQIVLSQTDRRPMYRQIQERVRELVAAGDWLSGWEIPSIRQMAASLSVSVITVKRAYLELERDGVIVTRQGKGSQVAEAPGLRDRLRENELEELLQRLRVLMNELDLSVDDVAAALSETGSRSAPTAPAKGRGVG